MTDLILVAVLAAIVGAAARYIYKAKKRGAACIGCPAAGGCRCGCSASASSACGCHTQTK